MSAWACHGEVMYVCVLGGLPLTLPLSLREPLRLNLEPVAGQPEQQPEPS